MSEKACKFCGESGLSFKNISTDEEKEVWRLHDKNGIIHSCGDKKEGETGFQIWLDRQTLSSLKNIARIYYSEKVSPLEPQKAESSKQKPKSESTPKKTSKKTKFEEDEDDIPF